MAPLINPFKREPRYPLDKPATPALVEKIDRLNDLFHQAMLLRKEIEQDWIRLTKEERERFTHLSASSQIRSAERRPTARPNGPATPNPRSGEPRRRRSLLEQIERFTED